MNDGPKNERGFTLLEISATCLLFGIVAAVAIAGTGSMMRSSRMAGAANTLETDVRYARSLANTQRRNVEIRFASTGYSIVVPAISDTVVRRVLPSGVTCSASGTATFFAYGLTSPTTVTITIPGRTNTVAVAANGNVSRY